MANHGGRHTEPPLFKISGSAPDQYCYLFVFIYLFIYLFRYFATNLEKRRSFLTAAMMKPSISEKFTSTSARASNMVALTTCVPSDILPYIHQFLEDNGFSKTAKYLRKEWKLAVPVAPVNPTLIDIFNNFFNTTEESTNPLQQVNDDETKNTVEREKTKKKSKRKRQVSESLGYEELNTKKQKPDTDEIDDEEKENDKAEELVPEGKKNKGSYLLF